MLLFTFLLSVIAPWVVYYGKEAKPEVFAPYNPVVLESHVHPRLTPLLEQQKEVLGYLNLGESEEWRSWFAEIKKEGLLIHENPNWKGSWVVDIRKTQWQNLLLDRVIPEIFAQGFTGLFYDQLDVVIALEEKYPGMKEAAIALVKSIRTRFPGKKIMMNRAYEILEHVGSFIDYELAESLYTDYNFETKKYVLRTPEDYEWQMNYLNPAKQKFPQLIFFSLDYWDPKDTEMIKKIYSFERNHGFRPYVSTISLDKIIPEP